LVEHERDGADDDGEEDGEEDQRLAALSAARVGHG
jgi:hypothetical protein